MPEGGSVLTLIGPDGAGKSTQAALLCTALGASARYIYMGSNPSAFTHALPTTKAWLWARRAVGRAVHHPGPPEPGGMPRPESSLARGVANLKSLAVVALRVPEDLYRLAVASEHARRGRTVILDRHPYPDYYTRRVCSPEAWLRWGDRLHGLLLRHVYARPQNLVLLDAPAEVLYARKPEGSLTAVEARRQEYLDLVQNLPEAWITVIDAGRPPEAVLSDLLGVVARGGRLRGRPRTCTPTG